ncbi:alpha/beta hydrolase [Bradyrhizobium sp. USDA 4353]
MNQAIESSDLPAFIAVGAGEAARQIAVRARPGTPPGLFWLGGFNSDMKGTKAVALEAWAAERGRACVRFDYSGHGESGGRFVDGTIGRWLEESVAVFRQFCRGPQVVIGSSMGGWMALLLARELLKQPGEASLAGLVLIAPGARFHRGADVEGFLGRDPPGDRDQWRLDAAFGVWRALSDHARPDRGRPKSPAARQRHQCRLPRAHPPGRPGPRRALAACLRAGAPVAGRGRGADHDPGR